MMREEIGKVGARESKEALFAAVRLAMKSSKEWCGLDPKGSRLALERLGLEMGHAVSKVLKARNREELVDELSSVWDSQSLGQLEVSSIDPFVVDLRDCFDCLGNKYGVGVTLCPFKEGFLRTVIGDTLGLPSDVVEIECCGTFQDHCRFEIKVQQPPTIPSARIEIPST